MTEHRFIEPHDVLFFRGNRLFGEAPHGGGALMPPWPSVFAGALRTAMATHAGADPAALRTGQLPEPLAACLGSADAPGSFAISNVTLGRRIGDAIEALHPMPEDLAVYVDDGATRVYRLNPVAPPESVRCSASTERLPVPQRDARGKSESGYWLTHAGWSCYLHGGIPTAGEIVHRSALWTTDPRLGIGLEPGQRRAAEGALYTTEGIRLQPGVGFIVAVDGVTPDLLPQHATLRLGGDGRAASLQPMPTQTSAAPDPEVATAEGACRVVLTSPGIFPGGWALPGMVDGEWRIPGAQARIVAAAIPRAGTISGWDLAHQRPKPASKAAPAGSVYWLDHVEGDRHVFRKLAVHGLWDLIHDNVLPSRRAEGFNRCAIANA
jgi:CRISPR-associated protein Cmr3